QTSLSEATQTGDHARAERMNAALALCRSLIAMEQASRELEEAHRRAMELHASERNDIASALDDLLAGATGVPAPHSAPGLGMGLSLGSTFVLPFALGVVELERPASLAAAPVVEPVRPAKAA